MLQTRVGHSTRIAGEPPTAGFALPEEVDREVDWGVLGMYFASAALGWPRIGGGCRARKGSRSWTRQKCRSRGRDSSAFKNARRRRRCRLSSKSVAQRSRSGTTPNLASAACLPTALSKLIHDLDLKWIGWLCCAAPYPQAHSALTPSHSNEVKRKRTRMQSVKRRRSTAKTGVELVGIKG